MLGERHVVDRTVEEMVVELARALFPKAPHPTAKGLFFQKFGNNLAKTAFVEPSREMTITRRIDLRGA